MASLIEWVVEPGQDEGGDTYSVVNVETGEYAGTYESSYVAHVIRDTMNGIQPAKGYDDGQATTAD